MMAIHLDKLVILQGAQRPLILGQDPDAGCCGSSHLIDDGAALANDRASLAIVHQQACLHKAKPIGVSHDG